MSTLIKATTIGPDLVQQDLGSWEIDLSNLRIFFGLSILARSLSDEIQSQIQSSEGDVTVLYKLNPSINQELIDMHFQFIQIYALSDVMQDYIVFQETFQEDLRVVLGTFQRQSVAKKLHPEFYSSDSSVDTPMSLYFPFHRRKSKQIPYAMLMERVVSKNDPASFFIRITVDSGLNPRVSIKNIPHLVLEDFDERTYLAGATKLSESFLNGALNSAKKGDEKFSEERSEFSKVFDQLRNGGYQSLNEIQFFWDKNFGQNLISSNPKQYLSFFKKLFLLLEDHEVASILGQGELIFAVDGKIKVQLRLKRLGRILEYSINKSGSTKEMSVYLNRMPQLRSIANQESHSMSFEGQSVFLIHHITSEIVAVIEALHRLKVKTLDVAFVKYGGNIPPLYLDALLHDNSRSHFLAGLEFKVNQKQQPYYGLSSLYSDTSDLEDIRNLLEERQFAFYEAMKHLSIHLFLRKILSLPVGEKILLIEDGGYVAPNLSQLASKQVTLSDICKEFVVPIGMIDPNKNFGEFYPERVIGSIEHTRNGYDRLLKTQSDFGQLSIPAFSIAISQGKSKEESREVAHSILQAVQSVLNGLGKVLSHRKILVLGSMGNIGTFLERFLKETYLHPQKGRLLALDRKSSDKSLVYSSPYDLKERDWKEIDFILGVTGESVLKIDEFLNWILESDSSDLYLASGSTKTVEFSDFMVLSKNLLEEENFSWSDYEIETKSHRILDPQTQMDLGTWFELKIKKGKIQKFKNIYLISDGSPVNFLFFGVPTESMDPVLSDLMSVSLGLLDIYKKKKSLDPKLYAVDHEIDNWGNPI